MKKKELLGMLRNEINGESSDCTIEIKNAKMKELEKITFGYKDYQYKIDFIDNAYDDDLINKSAPFISIVGYDFN